MVRRAQVQSGDGLMRLLDCYLLPFMPREAENDAAAEAYAELVKALPAVIEPLFFHCLTWAVGGLVDLPCQRVAP